MEAIKIIYVNLMTFKWSNDNNRMILIEFLLIFLLSNSDEQNEMGWN